MSGRVGAQGRRQNVGTFALTDIPDLRVCIDARAQGLSDNASVTSLVDTSGMAKAGGSFVAAVGTPTFKATGMGGPSIRFSGAQVMVAPGPIMRQETGETSAFSYAAVLSYSIVTSQRVALVFGDNAAGGFGLGANVNGTGFYEINRPSQGHVVTNVTAQVNKGKLFVVTFDGSLWRCWINNVLVTLGSLTTTPPVNPPTRACLGAYSSGAAFPFAGDVALVLGGRGAWHSGIAGNIWTLASSIWSLS